ncbi:MAG: hypothetical protein VB064_11040 [Oscillospiraceae bacterium]|nr:hypothetical protein [Oscillospiraceae bacterium]
MKRCSVYEILKCLANGGYIAWLCDTHDRRKIKLMSQKDDHSPADLVGFISGQTFDALCGTGMLIETGNSVDKYGTKCRYIYIHDPKAELLHHAFALACRVLDDNLPVRLPDNQSWRDYILERVRTEPVCRVCGCTEDNACPGGCCWVEPDLCSTCAEQIN